MSLPSDDELGGTHYANRSEQQGVHGPCNRAGGGYGQRERNCCRKEVTRRPGNAAQRHAHMIGYRLHFFKIVLYTERDSLQWAEQVACYS